MEFISPLAAEPGDLLVLTKPLGTQIICNAFTWLQDIDKKQKILKVVCESDILSAHEDAVKSMSRLNRMGAILMHKYKAHAATDVTGFGILGHANNLAKHQGKDISFVIDRLPVIKTVLPIAEVMNRKDKFLRGTAPETSGKYNFKSFL